MVGQVNPVEFQSSICIISCICGDKNISSLMKTEFNIDDGLKTLMKTGFILMNMGLNIDEDRFLPISSFYRLPFCIRLIGILF